MPNHIPRMERMGDTIARLQQENADLTRRLAEAEAIVEKLPKTADGVRVIPGMLLYSETMTPQRVPNGGIGISFAAVCDTDSPELAEDQSNGTCVFEDMYSSEEALEAALKARGEVPNA